jgi:hypothetical protein
MTGRVVHGQAGVPEEARSRAETWIIVCEHFHGALGPVPSERLADELAALASEMGGCTYRPVRLALARGRVARRAVHEEPDREPKQRAEGTGAVRGVRTMRRRDVPVV